MANLIDETYFVRGLHLAQLGQLEVSENVESYITRYERVFLTKALGYEFSKLMLANPTAPRFVALISGSEYTINDVVSKWEGFTNLGKVSPIANYVYYQYLADSAENVVGIGTAQNKAENAMVVSPINKMVLAWNDMRSMLKNLYGYMYANQDTYAEFDIKQTDNFDPQNIYF
jgi:hypothetical protein